jgi:hypothetical protein
VLKNSKIVLLLSLFFAGSMWFYVQRILIPFQNADALTHDHPRGNLSDLYPRWLGARELLLHHRDPYSAEITREIQIGYYGRPLNPTQPRDPIDQQRFAYPVYVVFLLAPTINLPFPIVHAGFGWLLLLLTSLSVLLWLRVQRQQPPPLILASLVLLTLGCFPVVQGLKLQQLSLLVSSLIAGSVALVVSGQLLLGGVLLGLATIKPQLTLLITLWFLLWAISDWRARKHFILGFCLTMIVLLAGAEYVLPGWIVRFHEALIAYRQYIGGGGSVLDTFTTPLLGKALAGIVLLALAFICWRTRRTLATSREFSFIIALVLAVTIAVIPMTAVYNHVLLLPAIFLIIFAGSSFSITNFVTRTIYVACVSTIIWPWLATVGLSLACFFLPADVIQRAWRLPLYTSLAIPLAVLTLLIPQGSAIFRRVSQP